MEMNALFAVGLVLIGISADSADIQPDSAFRRFNALPVAGYSTETALQMGGLGIVYFRPLDSADRGSEIDVAAMATTRGQKCLVVAPSLSTGGDGIVYRSNWKLLDWPAKYWAGGDHPVAKGLGLPLRMTVWAATGELEASLRRFSPLPQAVRSSLRPSLLYDFERNRTKLDSAPGLERPSHLGGDRTGVGGALGWDSRDQENWPRAGTYGRVTRMEFLPSLGGDWRFADTKLDLRAYLPAPLGGTWAFSSFWEAVEGDVPFDRLAAPDGTMRMRGLERGRLRGRQQWDLQGEARFPVARRFALVGFVDAAKVGTGSDFLWNEDFHCAPGFGGRYSLNPDRGVNLRADFAWVDGGMGATVSFKEAF